MNNLEFLRKKIKFLRNRSNKLQKEVCDFLGVSQNTYSDYELGKIIIPFDIIIKLADYYCVSIDYLLNRSDNDIIIFSKEYYEKNKNYILKAYIK